MKQIPFLDYKAVNDTYADEMTEAARRVINSGWYVLGPEVSNFEEEFAGFCGTDHCIGVSSGLEALVLILESWKRLGKISEDDEVIVPANTYIASILAISQVGLNPVLVEPDSKTYNIDPNAVKKAITSKTKVIMAVHLYGQCADMDSLNVIAKEHNLLTMEDSAQAHAATYKWKRAGNLSDASAFSFYPGKNLGAIGEAGAVTTNCSELADMIKLLRNYGSEIKYHNKEKGYNNRIDELQCAMMSVKLKHLQEDTEKRQELAQLYLENITNPDITLPTVPDFGAPCWHLFVILHPQRDKLADYLNEQGVATAIHYPIPPHKQNAYRELSNLDLPITEYIHTNCLSLPISPVHTKEEILYVSKKINEYS
ncbi:DegT/DnrJ/EryC1/StrS family aminotransferase [Lentisphaera marina]|uniref:DegT/DnrJ/EryC1/StrS family aminotransferase n=1 Tax=Lentisphaera marina TaxID=1111041 RepID=UPI002365BFA8|nr:DegT/DnrJ/EryC1/StrS family aminotransferase [Lentisphaera marina]MDD7986890.1 DegT/DnrJ/EryC1/StrS family aminotransferase [Lentisphaera marina]